MSGRRSFAVAAAGALLLCYFEYVSAFMAHGGGIVRSKAASAMQRRWWQSRRASSVTMAAGKPRTLYDKIFDDHVVAKLGEDGDEGGNALIYIDRHLVHEVTSPQAFEGLRTAGRAVRRPECTLATVDHMSTLNSAGITALGGLPKIFLSPIAALYPSRCRGQNRS